MGRSKLQDFSDLEWCHGWHVLDNVCDSFDNGMSKSAINKIVLKIVKFILYKYFYFQQCYENKFQCFLLVYH